MHRAAVIAFLTVLGLLLGLVFAPEADGESAGALTNDSPQRIVCWHNTSGFSQGAVTRYGFRVGTPDPVTSCHPPRGIRVASRTWLATAANLEVPGTSRSLVTRTEPNVPGHPANHFNVHDIPINLSATHVVSDSRSRLRHGARWRRPTGPACHREKRRRVLVCRLSDPL